MRLVIENGKIEYGGSPIIENINFEVNPNSKIAIIGRNGSGKTSLLKVIEGELDLVFDSSNMQGFINKSNDFTIGYLKQISFDDENITLEDEILKCYREILSLKEKLEELALMMENEINDKLINEYTKTAEIFENIGGYYYQKEYHGILKRFGFDNIHFSKKLKEFSGGERTKIAFIKLLLSKPDLLLLDEPTNHLDIEAIEWLEEYLKQYKKAFIVVSHDREFINKVANVIYEIDNKTITKYSGNYDYYLQEKEVRYKTLEKLYKEQQKELKEQNELIERFRYKATKAKMVQSRIKQLEKKEIITLPKREFNKPFKMNINPLSESGREVLNIRDLEVGYKRCLAKLNFAIYKGQKLAIIGENGSGKSTILKTIMGTIDKLSGEYRYGFNVKIGYFDQKINNIVSDDSILEDYIKENPELTNQEARSDLGAFLFSGSEVDKKLSVLSGGEIVRLSLCKLFKKRPNLLILDEPTNHMDIYCKEVIEKMLKDYKGTIIFVSHDRYFVKKISDSILVLNSNNANAHYYPYGYEQYVNNKSNKTEIVSVSSTKNKISKDKFNDKSSLKKELSLVEKEIKKYEEEIKMINEEFEKEEVYTDFIVTRELEEKLEDLEDKLSSLMKQWEDLVFIIENDK